MRVQSSVADVARSHYHRIFLWGLPSSSSTILGAAHKGTRALLPMPERVVTIMMMKFQDENPSEIEG